MIKQVGYLRAPEEYWELPLEVKAKLVNGCGPKGFGFLVPETLWGLSVTPACNIHDYMYHVGKTEQHRRGADLLFLGNMIEIIENETRFGPLKWPRCWRAMTYYRAVRDGGGLFFKERSEEELQPSV